MSKIMVPLRLFLLEISFWLILASCVAAFGEIKPGCHAKCGNISIPYPFGITPGGEDDSRGAEGCSIQGVGYGYNINCNTSFDPPKPFIGTSNLDIVGISETHIITTNVMSRLCYDIDGAVRSNHTKTGFNLFGMPFTFSNTSNRFFVIGCNAGGVNVGFDLLDKRYTSQCFSICDSREDVREGTCNGNGCCQSTIQHGLKSIVTSVFRSDNTTNATFLSFDPCSYAFVAAHEQFTFQASDLLSITKAIDVPVILDWAIGNKTCEEARKDPSTFACQENSHCNNTDNNQGYRCTCFEGYKGNPYLSPGCIDVNECEDPNNPCEGTGICINTNGGFNCTCPAGSHGDGRKDRRGCISDTVPEAKEQFPIIIKVALGMGLGILFLIIASSWIYLIIRKKRLIEMKENFFQQNGGLLLRQQLSSNEGGVETSKIFTAAELKLATKNYDESLILGKGGYGTVYKGTLRDGRIVAIKKSKVVDQSQIEQFINEVVILTQINHRNVVKLLGCCLETEVPLLVYEYVPNGTLFQHIHSNSSSISWESRLRIASETAGALTYLHSSASIPIIHRDVKSPNILLDENYTAKVADFGASRLIPLDQTELSTLVLGTLGYLDPEYFHTSQLTEKSDVYSFGVVLVELLTAEMPITQQSSGKPRSLAPYFISFVEENKLFELLDARVLNEGTPKQVIAVAKLAIRCLSSKGEDRPTMRQVTTELESLRSTDVKQAWSLQPNNEKKSNSHFEPKDLYSVPITGSAAGDSGQYSLYIGDSGQYSLNPDTIVQMNMPR